MIRKCAVPFIGVWFASTIAFFSALPALQAQEMWGISNSNFSGRMGLHLNPSTIVGAPYNYEINFLALDAFGENTYYYYPQDETVIPRTITGSTRPGQRYLYEGSGNQAFFAHGWLLGPSYIKNKKQYAWAVNSTLRTDASMTQFNPDLGILLYDKFRNDSLYGVRIDAGPLKSAGASWIELGGTYGRSIFEKEHSYLKWAASVNALIGLNGFYLDARSLELTSVDTSNLVLHNIDATYAHAGNSYFGLRGARLGSTLGVTYIKDPDYGSFECNMGNDKRRKYRYRLGASLMDIGYIYYFNDATEYTVNSQTDRIWNGIDTVTFGSLSELDTTLLVNAGGTLEEKNFGIWLPLALSVQFDYQVRPNVFANVTVVNRLHFAANQIARGNQLNLSARYERRHFEGNLNYTLFEYKQPSLGLGLRYRFFVIGSDRLLQMLGLSDVKAFDFFFGIKFQFCKRPFSKGPDCPAISN